MLKNPPESSTPLEIEKKLREDIHKIISGVFTASTVPTVSRVHKAYEQVLISTLKALRANAGCIAFLDHEIKDFEAIIAHGYAEEFRWWNHVKYGEGIVSSVAESGTPRFSPDVKKELIYKPLRETTVSQITIPLYSHSSLHDKSDIFAVMSIESDSRMKEDTFNVAKDHLSKIIGLHLSRLRADLLTLRMKELYKLVNSISEEENFDKVIDNIMSALKTFVDSSEVALLVRFGGALKVTAKQDFNETPPSDLEIGISEGKGYTCYVAQTRRPFYCANVKDTERYPYYLEVVPKTRSQYTVPLIYRKDLIGILNIGSKIEYGFTQHDRVLIDIFANLVANAVYNSKLIKELRTISHQVNQKLSNVNFLESSIIKKLGSNSDVISTFKILQQSVNEAKSLVVQTAYPMRPEKIEEIDINALIKTVVDKITPLLQEESISFFWEKSQTTLPKMKIGAQHLEDVLNNIFWNAVEAMKESKQKKITLKTEIKTFKEIHFLVITIVDTGKGITENQIDKVFDPTYYKTPKENTRFGRGIGLWVCDQVLSNYGGYLELKKNTPTGTKALIHFPLN